MKTVWKAMCAACRSNWRHRASRGARPLFALMAPPTKKGAASESNTLQGGLVIFMAVLAVAAGVAYKARNQLPGAVMELLVRRPADVQPLKAPRMLALPEFSNTEYQEDMLWGAYRPALYFGMRTRAPKSLLNGLMWFDPDSHDTLNKRKVRHHASLDDKLSTYGWRRHDGRGFGRQQIVDEEYNLTVSMLRHRSKDSGTGGDWAVRVAARRVRGGPRKRISLVMYIGDEAPPTWPPWKVMPEGDTGDVSDGVTLVTGGNGVVGPWSFHAKEHHTVLSAAGHAPGSAKRSSAGSSARLDYLALPTEDQYDYLLHVKELMLGIMYEQLERNPSSDKFQLYLPNGATTGSNLALFQVTVSIPSAVDFVFLSHKKGVDPSLTDTSERVAQLSGDALTKLLNAREEAFDRRFEYVFLGAPRPSPAPHPPGEEGGNEARVGSVGGVGQGREASDDLSDESNASVGAGSDGEQGGQEGAGASSGGGGSSSDSSSSSGDSGVDARDEGSGGSSRDGAPSGTSGAGAGEGASTGARAAGAGAGGAGLAGAGGRTLRPSWYQVSGADADTIEVAKTALSNLLGSLGYWHGTVQVRTPDASVHSSWPTSLFSAVPSRSLFPHGHMKEEGLHQLLVQRWDMQLAREVTANWLDLINSRGWIPREVILGEDARSHAPEDSLLQDAREAAPPTLLLPIMEMARLLQWTQQPGAEVDDDLLPELNSTRLFLEAAWPRLVAWYSWLNTTQQGALPTSYRWRGRNATTVLELNPTTPASGMDDYPRASHPSTEERHLDLRCWMALASEVMALVGEVLHRPEEEVGPYRSTLASLQDLEALRKLHGEPESGTFSDYGLHSDDAALQRRSYPVEGQVQEITFRVFNTAPSPRAVPCVGYVTLFPMLMRLLPADSEELGRTLQLLKDPQHLWSDYGIRSLSPQCSLYKKYNTVNDPPYWRGQVWLGMNYLTLYALEHYAALPGPHSRTARLAHFSLRRTLLNTVGFEYKRSGYLWEQYDDSTGRGQGSHPYTGSTALIATMLMGPV